MNRKKKRSEKFQVVPGSIAIYGGDGELIATDWKVSKKRGILRNQAGENIARINYRNGKIFPGEAFLSQIRKEKAA